MLNQHIDAPPDNDYPDCYHAGHSHLYMGDTNTAYSSPCYNWGLFEGQEGLKAMIQALPDDSASEAGNKCRYVCLT